MMPAHSFATRWSPCALWIFTGEAMIDVILIGVFLLVLLIIGALGIFDPQAKFVKWATRRFLNWK